MTLDLPIRPARISREQARAQKEREKIFAVALRGAAKASGWRCARSSVFRQHGDWFVDVLPSLLWQRGVRSMFFAKPMSVDPLFWAIVGLPDNNKQPLSFRSSGVFVVRPPFTQAHLSLGEADPERLARDFVRWCDEKLHDAAEFSVEEQLTRISGKGPLRKNFVAAEICLHLSRGDFESAEEACRNLAPGESGGFHFGKETFVDRARRWIAAARRN